MFCHCETHESEVSSVEWNGESTGNPGMMRDARFVSAECESLKRQHTPGPWDVRISDPRQEMTSYEIRIVSTATGFRNEVATFLPIGDGDYDGTTLAANVALAVAAPEMLRELENVLFRLDMEPAGSEFPCSALRDGIRRTIERARTITPKILAECSRLAKDNEGSDDASCDFD